MTDAAARPAAKPCARPGFLRGTYRRLRAVLALIGLLMIVYHVGFDLSQIVSPSMTPTLRGDASLDGDWVLSERVTFRFRHPRRWEVVRCVDKDGNQVMKRVVGLPGERVQILDGQVVIDGQLAPRPASLWFLNYLPMAKVNGGKSVDCGDGYFLLGDDTSDSWDSRYEGPFEPWRIRARAWAIVAPWRRRGWVNP